MKLTPEQQAIRTAILREADRRGLPRKGRKVVSALETGIVESNLRNLPGGDADSQGWRQERKSLYPNPRNVTASVKRYFDEAAKADTGKGSAGQLAARVQRPAAQYRGRYDQHRSEAFSLLGGASGGSSSGGSPSRTTTTTTPGVDNSDVRRQLVAQYLTAGHQSSDDLLNLALAVRGAKDTPGSSITVTSQNAKGMAPTAGGGSSLTSKFRQAANKIDAQHLPYSWGGGHGGKTAPGAGVPLDCSGAVSSVLGINPRVSGQFAKFGSPGVAPGGKGVTVFSNGHHVFMMIDGHYFGTSGTNPKGGAGWIPRSAISASYLKGFTARHLARAA